ncbi:MAG: ABC transporter ATP-binding protein [Puia sp.]|nr:ABC transporter ATP-binding protein [Puia sp.]
MEKKKPPLKQKNRLTRKVFAYFKDFARPHATMAVVSYSLFAAGFACSEILRPYIVKYVIDGTLAHTITPLRAMLLFAAAVLLYNAFFRTADYAIISFEARMSKILYDGSLRKILGHSPLFFINFSDTGRLITRIRRYTTAFETLFEEFTFRVSIMAIYAIGVTGLALATDYRIGALLLLFIASFSFISILFLPKKMELDKFSTDRESAVSGALADVLLNVQTIKHYGQHPDELERFGRKTTEFKQAQLHAQRFYTRVRMLKGAILLIFDTLMVGLLCQLYTKGAISVGTMYLFFSYSFQLSMAIWTLDEGLKKITKSIADAGELVDIFEHPVELTDAENKVEDILHASIRLENVSYAYMGGREIFKNLSLDIPAGQKIGICGTTGSGKSTLANLLLRMMDPTEGSIRVGNRAIKDDFSLDGLKNWISYVPQNIDIFNRTVLENIRFADSGASDEEAISAAKRARMHEFILSLPSGYQTLIGEKGLKLSGGQRQRIGIARALLRNTPVLILDEATSALDVMTESEILEILNKEFIGKTVIVIAHRLSTIRDLDRILVLEMGRIVEDGKHGELMALRGVYFNFIQAQAERHGHADHPETHAARRPLSTVE